MNIQNDKAITIYTKEYNNKKYYKTKLSKKLQDGSYENGYIDIQFKKGIEFNDKEQIYLKNAFLTFYKSKEKATIPYIFVMDFEKLEDTIEHSKDIVKQDTKDEFKDLGTSLKAEDILTEDDFPF